MFTPENVRNALRSGGTQRYHTHAARMLKTQDVAQHSYNVVWLVLMLTRGAASRDLILAAMSHDSGEHWVGDVPAPTKRRLEIRHELAHEEELAISRNIGLEASPLSLREQFVLKLCDSLEGALYCCTEIEMGNSLMVGILENFLEYVDELLHGEIPDIREAVDLDLLALLLTKAREPLSGAAK